MGPTIAVFESWLWREGVKMNVLLKRGVGPLWEIAALPVQAYWLVTKQAPRASRAAPTMPEAAPVPGASRIVFSHRP